MKTKALLISLILVIGIGFSAKAQPYTLDEKIKPVKLELQDVKSKQGAKSIIANSTMMDEPQYYYVNGCSMYQFIDVFIFSNFGSPNFTVELAKNTWNEVERTATTGGSKNGIVNFKLRTEGDFGFKIVPTGKKINYSIIIYASEPVEEFLGSAFKKADKDTIEGGEDSASGGNSKSSDSSNTILYILLGVALLVIGFLASKVLSRKKTTMLLLLFGLGASMSGFAQGVETFGSGALEDGSYEEWLREEVEAGVEALDEGLDRLGEVGEIIRDDERYKTVRDLYDSYTGLGDCISSVPPPGMPRVPSFCETDECGSCFVEARSDFNTTRYSFERLKTIYNCTKTFTDAAISFGDNVSGIHGVSGLAWQSERRKIEKSIKNLQKAYDNKYRDLLEGQKRALMKLNECEAQHGISDWYDRFGYMYYEFTAMHYKRPD
ncbi:MAG: hypothetical protein K8F54_02205 [Altibacter sp.]|uniref:hypothetical protein n=1 Tax=Altibacter sp. TaxID=2024823 RepID=UPI001DAD03E2|nr:hypothetical protein [Altibacter sp.]MBZ0326394.1 hypothetical protein [Altibacter sp.]